jgi:hypothetical protein
MTDLATAAPLAALSAAGVSVGGDPRLAEVRVDLAEVPDLLQRQGVAAFATAWEDPRRAVDAQLTRSR